tara:strand:+ start:88 stop:657 length:570 start_codon:yes stop_codon:yes gene_type:complete
VRDVFTAQGHDAWSCDYLPSETPGNHLVCDVIYALGSQRWDLAILHPPCTALAVSGSAWYGQGRPKNDERELAVAWTCDLWFFAIAQVPMVCMENPVNVLPIKASQYIQPWQFGHNASKKTGLWLHNLPPLIPTDILPPERYIGAAGRYGNQTDTGQNRESPGPDRWKKRSRTYQGIADAMAEQWGSNG